MEREKGREREGEGEGEGEMGGVGGGGGSRPERSTRPMERETDESECPVPTVERMWHTQDSQGQILALASS